MTTTAAEAAAHERSAAPRRGVLSDWRPEDPVFWEQTGARTARRNLACSVLVEHVGFSVWSLWSVLVLFLGPGYGVSPEQKFLLTAVPTALGAALRLPYAFAVTRFGGRRWTVVSAALLLVPTTAAAFVLTPGTPFGHLLAVACLAGVGGGSFASSMANVNAFYPRRLSGWALGVNAGGGNLGVASVQLVGLLVLGTAGAGHPRVMLLVYLPLVVLAAVCALFTMDDLPVEAFGGADLRALLRARHTWLVSALYVGSFGSFIGFGFAFGQVLQVQFHDRFATPASAASLTFLGPLLGSLLRPVGGRLADARGGARVTFLAFLGMALAAVLVLTASRVHSLPLFLTGFVALFVLSGVGNGSTYKMIPGVSRLAGPATAGGGPEQERAAQRRSSALIGVAGALGAFGGVLVNITFRQSFLALGNADAAYAAFLVAYLVCALITWRAYVRGATV